MSGGWRGLVVGQRTPANYLLAPTASVGYRLDCVLQMSNALCTLLCFQVNFAIFYYGWFVSIDIRIRRGCSLQLAAQVPSTACKPYDCSRLAILLLHIASLLLRFFQWGAIDHAIEKFQFILSRLTLWQRNHSPTIFLRINRHDFVYSCITADRFSYQCERRSWAWVMTCHHDPLLIKHVIVPSRNGFIYIIKSD